MYCSRATTGGRVLKFIAAITLKENIACFLGWMDLPALGELLQSMIRALYM